MDYLNDEKYIEAEKLYIEALNSTNEEEQIRLLQSAIDICDFYFDARTALLELANADALKYQNEINDIYNFIKIKKINIQSGRYYDVEIGRSLLRAYYRMYRCSNNCLEALKIIEKINELDNQDHFKQKLEYIISLIRCKEYKKLIELYKKPKLLYEYIALFFIYLALNDYPMANESLKQIAKINPNVLGILFGIMIITEDDSKNIFENPYFDSGSEEEAYYYVQKIGEAIVNVNDYLSQYVNNNFDIIMPYISAGNYELYILLVLLTLKETTGNDLINELKGIGEKKTDYYASLSDISDTDLNTIISSMLEKGFIKKNGLNYRISYLGYSILKATADNFEWNVVFWEKKDKMMKKVEKR